MIAFQFTVINHFVVNTYSKLENCPKLENWKYLRLLCLVFSRSEEDSFRILLYKDTRNRVSANINEEEGNIGVSQVGRDVTNIRRVIYVLTIGMQ